MTVTFFILVLIIASLGMLAAFDQSYDKKIKDYQTELVNKGLAEWITLDPSKPAQFKLK